MCTQVICQLVVSLRAQSARVFAFKNVYGLQRTVGAAQMTTSGRSAPSMLARLERKIGWAVVTRTSLLGCDAVAVVALYLAGIVMTMTFTAHSEMLRITGLGSLASPALLLTNWRARVPQSHSTWPCVQSPSCRLHCSNLSRALLSLSLSVGPAWAPSASISSPRRCCRVQGLAKLAL